MDIYYTISISPVPGKEDSQVLIKANPYRPVTLGGGHVLLDQTIWTGNPLEYAHAQVHLLAILAKISHEIANDTEEAGFTAMADLMLKLSEHK